MSISISRLSRIVAAATLLAGGLTAQERGARPARAAAPSISIAPTSAPPHGTIQVLGSGFDPSTNGQQVRVDIKVTTSSGTVTIGTIQTDSSGNVGALNAQPLTLPFALDAPGPNQITAVEQQNAGVTAAAPLTGVALQPQINGGQALSTRLGDQVEIKGTGFAPNDTISIALNGTPLNTANGVSTTTADSSGNVDILLVVPPTATPGSGTLTVSGQATGAGQRDQASIPITLTAAAASGPVQIAPNPAAVGTTIRVSAGGFQPNEPVTFTLRYYDIGISSYAIENAPATADADGNASTVINIPQSADGAQPGSVTANGIVGGRSVSSPLTFAVLASLSVSPPTALAGARVVIAGTGFVPGEALYVTTRLFKPPVGRFAVVDATGTFSATVTLLTGLQAGTTLPLAVSGSGGDNATTGFTVAAPVAPALQATPSTAAGGATIAVTGQGFGPNEGVSLTLAGQLLATAPVTTTALGVFTATVTLPPGFPSGSAALRATGATSGLSALATIAVTGAPANRWYFAEGTTNQSAKVSFHETIAALNANGKATNGSIVYMFPDGTSESLPIAIGAHSLLVEDVNRDLGPNRIASAMVQTDLPITAARTITRRTGKGPLDTDYSPGVASPQSVWYFAEGYSGVSFQPYLTVLNPQTAPVTLTVTLLPTRGAPAVVQAPIPGSGRYTLNLRGALPNTSFSMRVSATAPIVAERVQYWGDGAGSAKFGDGVKPGTAIGSRLVYFASASVLGGDQSFISLLDQGTRASHVAVTLFDGTGAVAGSTRVTLSPNLRYTINVGAIASGKHSPVAAIASGDQPFIGEEAQYFGGSPNIGAHPGASIEGRSATAKRWSFAAGDTATYQESEYILNPSSKAVTVTATFYAADGTTTSATYPVRAKSVITVRANALKRLKPGVHGSVWLSNGNPVVVLQTLRGKDGRSALADQGIPG